MQEMFDPRMCAMTMQHSSVLLSIDERAHPCSPARVLGVDVYGVREGVGLSAGKYGRDVFFVGVDPGNDLHYRGHEGLGHGLADLCSFWEVVSVTGSWSCLRDSRWR